MLDFLKISTSINKKTGLVDIFPKFIIGKSSDLMIRGRDFYAIWVEEKKLWSTDEQDAIRLIDSEMEEYAKKNESKFTNGYRILYMWDSSSGSIDIWHKYCQKQMRDNFNSLDDRIIFSNTETKKTDYASRKLPYPLNETIQINAYDRLMNVLYSEEERRKIEWAIGSIVHGDSKEIQKFVVLYGSAGTGKSTILNIIQKLFEGYYSIFDAKALGSSSNAFALEAFKSNPLVGIQHDGDLSRLEDNTRLNSLVSHEMMTVNEKFRSMYSTRFRCFLFMGTNKPVKITDAKSGLLRRLIDVSPTGKKLDFDEYQVLMSQINFELGSIAKHCEQVYLENKTLYHDYIPVNMLGASNDFYNFILDSFDIFAKENGVTLKAAWEMYKNYCDEAKILNIFSQRIFKEELKNYFETYKDRHILDNGTRTRSYYYGFKTEKFEDGSKSTIESKEKYKIQFKKQKSIFDEIAKDYISQYASDNETPIEKWDEVTTKLSDLDTKKLHYVRVPINHIVIDFDIKDENGEKSFEKNLEEANKFPPTYSELSKSGKGIHLHYIYKGDPERLSRIYDDDIEVKVFSGKSSLRRKLTKCNDLPISDISSGLPLKEQKVINKNILTNEKGIRTLIKRNINKEYHGSTTESIHFINEILEKAYKSGVPYDVSDLHKMVLYFAMNSTNQAKHCVEMVSKMKFKSENASDNVDNNDAPIVFFDVEVFPNLVLVNWKKAGEGNPVVRMINPKPEDILNICKNRLIGFNCRRYDNHILYAIILGKTTEQIFKISEGIINNERNCFFGEAYNLSYTDVYDFSSVKQSLKKFEIELGIHHKELGLPWNEPVPEEKWIEVAEYCDNDVIATEAVFNARQGDFFARQILAELAGMTVNDTTNNLTTRIIFGGEKNPQSSFNYRNLALPVK